VGYLLGTFTPGAIGADAYRAAALSRFRKNKVVISTILLERSIGLAVIGTFALIALPISTQYMGELSKSLVWVTIAGTVLVVATVSISLSPAIVKGVAGRLPYLSRMSIMGRLRGFYQTYAEFRKHRATLIAFTALTAVEVALIVSFNYLIAKSLNVDVSFVYFLGVIPLLHILIRIPITLYGIGIQEGLFAYFLVTAGFSVADGLAISLLIRVTGIIILVLPAAVFLWLRPLRIDPDSNCSI